MALASEIMGGGTSAGQALAMGGTGASVAAAGTTATDATVITASIVIATAADGTKGIRLKGSIGDEIWVFNNSASTLKVWPDSGAGITITGTGLGTADAAFSHLTFKTVLYKKQSATQWFIVVT